MEKFLKKVRKVLIFIMAQIKQKMNESEWF
jgi:hypothetical protein